MQVKRANELVISRVAWKNTLNTISKKGKKNDQKNYTIKLYNKAYEARETKLCRVYIAHKQRCKIAIKNKHRERKA